jgi:anthranilate synthase component 1
MEIIDDLETTPREAYGGGVGYYSWTGDADFAIVIRTATLDESGDESVVGVRAGAGLVADSDPAAEYEETEQKMDGVLTAIDRIREGGARGGDAESPDDDEEPLATGTEADG